MLGFRRLVRVSFIAGAGAGAELLGGLEMLALSLLETALKSIESAVPIEWSIVWRIGTGRIRMAIIANMKNTNSHFNSPMLPLLL